MRLKRFIERSLVLLLGIAIGIGISLVGSRVLQSAWILGPKDVLRERGRLYVIGTGPAGPQMATLQALETMKKMDVIIAPPKQAVLFTSYIGGKPNLFHPWEGFFDYNGKRYYDLDKDELALFKNECFRLRDERVAKIRELLAQGKDVGLLDAGNPCLFGPSHWYLEQFSPEDVAIIPGVGSDAAALAALGKSIMPAFRTRFVAQTTPFFLQDQDGGAAQALHDFRKHDASMVFYMALEKPERLFQELAEAFPADMPCAVVYWAGFPVMQKIVHGNVGNMLTKLSGEKETYMGILFVGRFLEGKPYETSMRESLISLSRAE